MEPQINRNDPRFSNLSAALKSLTDSEFSLVINKLMTDSFNQEDEPSKETNE